MKKDIKDRFTEEEVSEIKQTLDEIGVHLDTNKADWVWAKYTKLINKAEKKPCLCGKSAGHWRRAVETLRTFVKDWYA
jgi:hypothetical protein